MVPGQIAIPDTLRKSCAAPKVAGNSNKLALRLEASRLCEQVRAVAILGIVDGFNQGKKK